ncbi:CAP family protein [Embleya sp. NBC_00896]|uniref:CAP family protein n=1 Tax=Embleya sp. NBC_00896 TaxID=2975961 RepID=UPI00386E6872|nr:CAP family protein [Embleya sp. NBC_00896]
MPKRLGVVVAAALLVVTAAAPAYARPAMPDTTDDAFLHEMLTAINTYRSRHGAPAVTLDPTLTTYAKSRANVVSTYEALEEGHRGLDRGKGETLYWGGSSQAERMPAQRAVKAWYDEGKSYDFPNADYDPAASNFTQLVWKGSRRIGAARATGKGSKWYENYIVVNWQSPGNVLGRFPQNVLPKR